MMALLPLQGFRLFDNILTSSHWNYRGEHEGQLLCLCLAVGADTSVLKKKKKKKKKKKTRQGVTLFDQYKVYRYTVALKRRNR